MYDIAYLRCIPNIVIMAPKDEAELQRMVVTGVDHTSGTHRYALPSLAMAHDVPRWRKVGNLWKSAKAKFSALAMTGVNRCLWHNGLPRDASCGNSQRTWD